MSGTNNGVYLCINNNYLSWSLVQIQAKHPLDGDEFDFDPASGELVIDSTEEVQDLDKIPTDVILESVPDEQTAAERPESEETIRGLVLSHYSSDPAFVKCIENAAQGRKVDTVVLNKVDNMSLGFSVVGLKSEHRGELGIFVQKIQPGGLADRYVYIFAQFIHTSVCMFVHAFMLEFTHTHTHTHTQCLHCRLYSKLLLSFLILPLLNMDVYNMACDYH